MTIYKGAKLYPKQAEIANKIVSTAESSDSVQYHIVNASRQVGKSFMLKQLLLYYAINEPNSKNLFVSMTYQQTNKIYNEIIKAIESSGVIAKKNGSENSIVLKNGSEIYFRSYQRLDTVRGTSANTLIVDEAAFVKRDEFDEILRPTLSTLGKRCILFSTPRGKNYFYEMAMMGQNEDEPDYHYYYANYRDNPFAKLKEIESAKRKLSDKIFKAEYEAEFIDGAMSVFSNYRNCITGNWQQGHVVAGIDVGNADDYTVLTIMNGNKVLCIERWRHMPFEEIIKNICNKLKEFKVQTLFCEINGLGSPFYEFLCKEVQKQRLRISTKPWTTTNISKDNIIQQLINDLALNNIIIPDDDELMLELSCYEAEYSKNSKAVIYNGVGAHDDMVMSLAITNYNRVVNTPSGNYHIRSI